MLEILYFAIVTQDENMVIALLKVIPNEILFFDKPTGDYLVSLLKHYQCKRAFDVLKSLAAKEVKASAEIKIEDEVSSEAKISDAFDKMWEDICSLSREKASLVEFKQQFAAYDSLLTIATNYSVKHCMRAAIVAFLLQDYVTATRHFAEGITHLRKADSGKRKAFTPDTMVDESLTELTFRFFTAFSVKPSEQYLNLLKNNLFRTKPIFCIGQDAFLFPLTATLNYETVIAAIASLRAFITLKRQLPGVELVYRDERDFKVAVKMQLFIIRRFYEWIVSLERHNSLHISYNNLDELNHLISAMKTAKLKFTHEFYGMKKMLLDIFLQCYRMLKVEDEWPYKSDFDKAVAIEKCALTRLSEITATQILQYVGPGESISTEVKSPKKRKKKPIKQEDQSPAPPALPKSDKPVDSYVELPTYYPNIIKVPELKTKSPAQNVDSPHDKAALKELEESSAPKVAEALEINPPISNFIVRVRRAVAGGGFFRIQHYVDFVDPKNKLNFFATHPHYYLEAVYLVSKYRSCSESMISAFNDAKAHIVNTLYQVPEQVLRAQFDTFVRHFGMLEAGKIFIKNGVFRFLVQRGIFPIQQPAVSAEKEVASPVFHS